MNTNVHVAGIVPIANLKDDFDLAMPSCMLPVEAGFSAIQKAVFECAMAGCNTIWIVANNDLAPILRKTVGDWVYDPVYYKRTYTKFYKEERREIPIYYVPIHPKDRDRRDSYGWSVLYGAYSAWLAAFKISRWITPEKYFVAFPLSAYDVYDLRQYRKDISHPEKNVFLTYQNKTVKDGEHLPFTLKGEDFKRCRNQINQKTTREYLPPLPNQRYPSEKRPISERWSARHFTLAEVFEPLEIQGATRVEIPWHYNLSTWATYREYLASGKTIKKPEKELTLPRAHVKIPYKT